jgi:hypothetical protein
VTLRIGRRRTEARALGPKNPAAVVAVDLVDGAGDRADPRPRYQQTESDPRALPGRGRLGRASVHRVRLDGPASVHRLEALSGYADTPEGQRFWAGPVQVRASRAQEPMLVS